MNEETEVFEVYFFDGGNSLIVLAKDAEAAARKGKEIVMQSTHYRKSEPRVESVSYLGSTLWTDDRNVFRVSDGAGPVAITMGISR